MAAAGEKSGSSCAVPHRQQEAVAVSVPAGPRLFLCDDACREESAQDHLDGLAGNAGDALQRLKALLADVVAGEHGGDDGVSTVRHGGGVPRSGRGAGGLPAGRGFPPTSWLVFFAGLGDTGIVEITASPGFGRFPAAPFAAPLAI